MINGNTGVALFSVLSGFLLSMPLWQGIKDANYPNIKQYFVNRVVRILPIYYLCLLGLLALKGFQGTDASFNNIVSHLFFLHNLKDQQVMSLNPLFWTLAVEFQFHLLLPVLFLLPV
jgi:peptidoglycan/LPS O-acetylase OafA/YrhL